MRIREAVPIGATIAAFALGGAGCGGGDDPKESAEKPNGPPPAEQVENAVSTILNTCIEASFDADADTTPVSEQVDRLIALFKAHDPDARMAESDLRATTLRQALTQVRDQVRECNPEDEPRINDALTSVPAPADAEPAPTAEPESDEPEAAATGGVTAISANLATLCVDKLADPGPASSEIAALVDELVAAWHEGPKNAGTTNRMRVALSNLRHGCGPDQANKVKDALDDTG
jgi:hypothetical protein